MSNVEFQEETVENFQSRRIQDEVRTSKMASFLIRNGLAKGPKTAMLLLIVVVLACFSLAAYLFFKVPDYPRNKELTTEDILKFSEEFERNNQQTQW